MVCGQRGVRRFGREPTWNGAEQARMVDELQEELEEEHQDHVVEVRPANAG